MLQANTNDPGEHGNSSASTAQQQGASSGTSLSMASASSSTAQSSGSTLQMDSSSRKTPDEVLEEASKDPELPSYVRRAIYGYKLEAAYFEAFEMLRKLALVGLAISFEPGSALQTAYGLVVSFISFGVYSSVKPFADKGEGWLAELAQLQIFFALVLMTVPKMDGSVGEDSDSLRVLDLLLLASMIALLGLAFVLELQPFMEETWCAQRLRQGRNKV